MKQILLLSVASCLVLSGNAATIAITSDTTVGEANVSTYLNADIDIAAGITLRFNELTAAHTFTGKLTGGGNFVVYQGNNNNATPRITFGGDATAFTGGFYITNHLITVNNPTALGSAKFTLQAQSLSAKYCYLNGPGKYTGEFDLAVCDTHPYGVKLAENTEISGNVYFRQGRFCGPGSITGKLFIGEHLYGQADLHLKGGVGVIQSSRGSLNSDAGVFYIDSPVDFIPWGISSVKSVIHFGYENALNAGQVLSIGVGYGPFGAYDLHGYNQCCGTLNTSSTSRYQGGTFVESSSYIKSDTPATLTLSYYNSGSTFYGNLKGAVSLDYTADIDSRTFTIAGQANDTTGKIMIHKGIIAFGADSQWTALTGIEIDGTGVLRLLKDESNTPFVDGLNLKLVLSDSGKVEIPEGYILEVNEVLCDGKVLPYGTYNASSDVIGVHITGAGTLQILNSDKKTEGKTFVWKGGTDDDACAVAANWVGDEAPKFDGTERLVFGKDGSSRAVIAGEARVFALELRSDTAFELAAADENAMITIEQGGVIITNEVNDTVVTHTISCPITLGYLPQNWYVAKNAVYANKGSLIGRASMQMFTIESYGRTMFYADNSQLETRLTMTACNSQIGQPFVYNGKGLGGANRPTKFMYCWPRFMVGDNEVWTNATPLTIYNGSTAPQGFTGNYHGKIVLTGEVLGEGSSHWVESQMSIPMEFRGGIKTSQDTTYSMRLQTFTHAVYDKPIDVGGLYFDYSTTLIIGVSGNKWSWIGPMKSTVKCACDDALCSTGLFKFGTDSDVYARQKNLGTLDLDGYNQKVGRLSKDWNPWHISESCADIYPNAYATVKSATPAVVEVLSDQNDFIPMKVEGAAGIHFNGTGSLAFTNFVCETVGTLQVSQGTVKLLKGAGWINTTNVLVQGTGKLVVTAGTGATAFGSELGKSAATLRVKDTGVLEIAEGEIATVQYLLLPKNETEERYVNTGDYGGPEAGLDAAHTLNFIAGKGRLRVKLNPHQGTMFIMR